MGLNERVAAADATRNASRPAWDRFDGLEFLSEWEGAWGKTPLGGVGFELGVAAVAGSWTHRGSFWNRKTTHGGCLVEAAFARFTSWGSLSVGNLGL